MKRVGEYTPGRHGLLEGEYVERWMDWIEWAGRRPEERGSRSALSLSARNCDTPACASPLVASRMLCPRSSYFVLLPT